MPDLHTLQVNAMVLSRTFEKRKPFSKDGRLLKSAIEAVNRTNKLTDEFLMSPQIKIKKGFKAQRRLVSRYQDNIALLRKESRKLQEMRKTRLSKIGATREYAKEANLELDYLEDPPTDLIDYEPYDIDIEATPEFESLPESARKAFQKLKIDNLKREIETIKTIRKIIWETIWGLSHNICDVIRLSLRLRSPVYSKR